MNDQLFSPVLFTSSKTGFWIYTNEIQIWRPEQYIINEENSQLNNSAMHIHALLVCQFIKKNLVSLSFSFESNFIKISTESQIKLLVKEYAKSDITFYFFCANWTIFFQN